MIISAHHNLIINVDSHIKRIEVLNHYIVFELCAETIEACLAAKHGGADRIELCTCLNVGGLTPPPDEISQAVKVSGLPIHILIRPHDQGYNYSPSDFKQICDDVQHVRSLGASGIVIGVLNADSTVDKQRTRTLVELAGPLEVTFHRAFDDTADIDQALQDVISTGCHRILTSGGKPDVLTGVNTLARLVAQAGDRIAIAVGGGLRLQNAREILHTTGARHFHSSVGPASPQLAGNIRNLVQALREG